MTSALKITKDLTIDGRAQGIAVSGDSDDDTDDMLISNVRSALTVILKNLTLTKGDDDGEGRAINRDHSVGWGIGIFELQSDERYTATVDTGGIKTFRDTLVTIEDNSSGVEPSGEITVIRHNQPPGGGAPDLGEMPFYVEIDPTIDSGLDTGLTICYTDVDDSRKASLSSGDTRTVWVSPEKQQGTISSSPFESSIG